MENWQAWPFAPEQGTALCALADIPENGAGEVVFGEGYDCFRVLLLRSGEGVRDYRNRCAHVHIPLNYELDVFHVLDGGVLMCAHHGAMYRIADGFCFDGPCEGREPFTHSRCCQRRRCLCYLRNLHPTQIPYVHSTSEYPFRRKGRKEMQK